MSCQVGSVCGCNFKNTGAAYPETWTHIHQVIDKEIGCEECNAHGHEMIDGIRDMVAAGIGKEVHDKKKFNRFVDDAVCVRNACRADGRC